MISRLFGCLFAAIVVLTGCQNLFNPPDDPVDHRGGNDPIVERTAVPAFSWASGTYSADIEVELSSTTAGATIYHTMGPIGDPPGDPEPGQPGTQEYTAAIEIAGDGTAVTIKAIAVASGYAPSAVVSANYVIDYSTTAAPTFNPAAGTHPTDIEVQLSSATAGATIYYTIGPIGDPPADPEPGESDTLEYTGPIEIAGDGTAVTIKAIAVAGSHTPSTVVSADYVIDYPVAAAPTFDPAGGTHPTDIEVELSSTTAGATIYYTIGPIGDPPADPEPNESGTLEYTTPIAVAGDGTAVTIKAIAVASGHTPSAVVSADYVIDYPVAAAPTFNPVAGTYSTDIEVELSSTTSGATIYYSIGPIGDPPADPEPNESGTLEYTVPIAIAGDGTEVTIKAIAVAGGHTPSTIVSANYVIDYADP